MGKLKRNKRSKGARVNPIGKKNEGSDNKDESTRQNKIVPLINKLQSSAANDRSLALSAITVLAEDDRMRQLLLKEKLISVIMEKCLNDSNDEVIVESFGLLRNIAIEEGYGSVKHIWRLDIWTSIEAALQKIETSFKYLWEHQHEKHEKAKLHLLYDFAENVLSLITALAGEDEDIEIKVVEKLDGVLDLVVNLIHWEMESKSLTNKLVSGLFEFLYDFSSDSFQFIQKLEQNGKVNIPKIEEYLSTSSYRLAKVFFIGTKFNIFEALRQYNDKEVFTGELLNAIYDVLTGIDINALKLSDKNLDNALEPIQRAQEVEHEIGPQNSNNFQVMSELTSIEVSMDIITSVIEFLSFNEGTGPIVLNENVQASLLQKTYVLISELLKSDNSLLPLEKELTAFNNLAWLFLTTESIPVEWFKIAFHMWDIVANQTQQHLSSSIQSLGLNILWALTKELGPEVRGKVGLGEIQMIITKAEETSQQDDLQYLLSAIGFLGSLGPIAGHTETTSLISTFLFNAVDHFSESKTISGAEVCIEGVNAIFDIFGDKEFEYDEEVFVKQGYLEKLQSLQPKIDSLYRSVDKNKYKQTKVRVEEIKINLPRFIEYKRTERQ